MHRHHSRYHLASPRGLLQVRMQGGVLDLCVADSVRLAPRDHLCYLGHHQDRLIVFPSFFPVNYIKSSWVGVGTNAWWG
ncbi:hypothetical protein MLD38_015352 [Melastoma candidum]|uniref:Uncharacterized protein n=1 Tax=Melastoma candidum TaxID=119954 RepID=A0ACB9RFW8_9MYRT|nr:hypothetical protein MLD38_015352 [Melastoma candidum]